MKLDINVLASAYNLPLGRNTIAHWKKSLLNNEKSKNASYKKEDLLFTWKTNFIILFLFFHLTYLRSLKFSSIQHSRSFSNLIIDSNPLKCLYVENVHNAICRAYICNGFTLQLVMKSKLILELTVEIEFTL